MPPPKWQSAENTDDHGHDGHDGHDDGHERPAKRIRIGLQQLPPKAVPAGHMPLVVPAKRMGALNFMPKTMAAMPRTPTPNRPLVMPNTPMEAMGMAMCGMMAMCGVMQDNEADDASQDLTSIVTLVHDATGTEV